MRENYNFVFNLFSLIILKSLHFSLRYTLLTHHSFNLYFTTTNEVFITSYLIADQEYPLIPPHRSIKQQETTKRLRNVPSFSVHILSHLAPLTFHANYVCLFNTTLRCTFHLLSNVVNYRK